MPLRVNILCGPTASGKSATGLFLAEKLGAQILSIDSMKIYRGLDIGTAKPTTEERARVVHHLIDIREPWQSFSVAEFLAAAEQIIHECAQKRIPLLAEGGTALYLKGLSEGLFDGPGRDPALRAELEAEGERIGVQAMHQQLAAVDPKAAAKILDTDIRRIVRALEVYRLSGKPISAWQNQWGVARTDLDVRIACLRLPRDIVYARVDRRIDAMLAAGWLDECRRLQALPHPLSPEASQAIGYRTLLAHLRGEIELKPARDRICFDTHHFARRQLNWFRRLPKLTFIDIAETDPVPAIAERVLQVWRGAPPE